ncbi:SDR family NAD(P)-dependent oxidoreductase [Streptomyces sp. ACA25]|uniref:SDR family NAD(P)-dependent oxidoreductase n=1 Tax=Streptomyces sp. ACA25 TaxID=3022596 RepID=UPI00230766F4|nr:SDR family NAD(P)-dependent oxidoreductase [Streptomyces sp. ACA25]MDB1086127.1 SDR family NAD(P)-dependent oxidoreductase [Streptomyces sp. ACA25]
MEIDGSRILVAGATGVIGGALAGACAARGASVAVAGRDAERLAERARTLGDCPARRFEAYDLDACAALAGWAQRELGGLDAVLTAVGVVAFGPAEEVPEAVAEHLCAVNALAPMAVLRGALPLLTGPGAVAAVTGVVVDRPQPGMAAYCASKSALSAWLTAVRGEQRRRRVAVVDARLPHLDTGFAGRAVAGTPPPMPRPADLDAAVRGIVDAVAEGAALVLPDGSGGVTVEAGKH